MKYHHTCNECKVLHRAWHFQYVLHVHVHFVSSRETPLHCPFLQAWRTLFLWRVKFLTLLCCKKAESEKKRKRKKRKGKEGRKSSVTTGGKRIRRPWVLEGVGLSPGSGGPQQQQQSCLTDSDEAADSRLGESSHSLSPPVLPPELLFTKRGDSSS